MRRVIKLLAQENPIIDLIARVPVSFLDKYKLPANSTISPGPDMMRIYDDLKNNFECDLRPAGAAYNALRACQVFVKIMLVCH